MITDGIKQSDKAKVFDWLVERLENGTLEMLFKADDSDGLEHFDSVSSFNGLINEIAVSSQHLARKKSAKYVVLTLGQFDDIRAEIYSSYSQSGCMDEDAAQSAVRAYRSMTKAEGANLISPLR
ncbi:MULTISPECIES: hypothetical protein [Vibrio]|uniref:hypothetical protein n=1 Tax=Vibrio TaxID=662 RepID=UPI00207530EC|nr:MULTISPECIES: hypothetical protein [Vibrio]USD35605.1 hypothetical protein J8Z27_22620 [Vibrio sp. SCSIO 43186]USD72729.1 hypothetical protein J4N41_22625 [Vibrio sp. SCSIO 43139]USD98936.1 hypothetical protein CTT30_22955 [Vibrio coralliilyticus]